LWGNILPENGKISRQGNHRFAIAIEGIFVDK
jgi:hypothetical protein